MSEALVSEHCECKIGSQLPKSLVPNWEHTKTISVANFCYHVSHCCLKAFIIRLFMLRKAPRPRWSCLITYNPENFEAGFMCETAKFKSESQPSLNHAIRVTNIRTRILWITQRFIKDLVLPSRLTKQSKHSNSESIFDCVHFSVSLTSINN